MVNINIVIRYMAVIATGVGKTFAVRRKSAKVLLFTGV